MFTIDFTKSFLYKDVIYFNQGNLAANNILRCKLVTGRDETLEGYIATVTFKTLSHAEINGTVNIVDVKNCIVDIKFPSNALEVGVNELEVILTKGEGIDKVVTPSPIIKYEVWQCLTTGNGIQGGTNYPILIDLMSEVNNAVRIANNASATADASLKETVKMLDVVNTNISKANEAIDNANSAKDKALNAVEEANIAKNSMIKDINSSKESMINDISTTKQNVIADTNKAIDKMNKDFEALTSSQQQDMEVIKARGKYDSLSQRFENLDKDLLKAKELATTTITTESNFVTVEETSNGYFKDIKLEGKSLVVNSQNEDVLPGTEGAVLKSVGDGADEIEVSTNNANLFNEEHWMQDRDGTHTYDGKDLTVSGIWFTKYNIDYIPVDTKFVVCGDAVAQNTTQASVAVFYKDGTSRSAFMTDGYVVFDSKAGVKELNFYASRGTQNTITYENVGIFIADEKPNFVIPKQDKKPLLFKDVDNVWKPIKELRGVAKACDTVEMHSDGKYYYHIRTEKLVLNGTENIVKMDSLSFGFKINNIINAKPNTLCICDTLKSIPYHNYYNAKEDGISIHDTTGTNIYFRDKSITSVDAWKQKLQTNNITIIYQLAEEKVYECTPIDLLTFENETNYSINCGVISPKTTLKCVSYIGNVINTLKEKVSNLENKLYNTNLANFTVALNTLDTKLKLEQLTKAPK